MKTYTAPNIAAIAARALIPRDFLSITVRDIITDATTRFDFWSDAGAITVAVFNPDTGSNENRTFKGVGTLIGIGPIAHVSNLTVQTIAITFSGLTQDANDFFRTENARQAKVEMWRGWFNTDTRAILDAAEPHFFGVVDSIESLTPEEGGEATIELTCVSSQELTRANPDTRSDASQRLRDSVDEFYLDAAAVGEWNLFWGQKAGKLTTEEVAPEGNSLWSYTP